MSKLHFINPHLNGRILNTNGGAIFKGTWDKFKLEDGASITRRGDVRERIWRSRFRSNTNQASRQGHRIFVCSILEVPQTVRRLSGKTDTQTAVGIDPGVRNILHGNKGILNCRRLKEDVPWTRWCAEQGTYLQSFTAR